MSAETVWIVGCVVLGVIGLWLVLRGRKRPEVIGGDPQPTPSRPVPAPPASPRPITTTLSALDHHVRQLAADGNKIEAIKAVREHTGLGLKEAKDYVEAIPNVVPLANFGQSPLVDAAPLSQEMMRAAAVALVAHGKKIEAIKFVREQTGLGLKEAKDYVDALENAPQPTGTQVLFVDGKLGELADSPMVRRAVQRAFEQGMTPELAAKLVKLTGKSDAEVRVLIDSMKPSQNQSPIT